MSVKVTAAVRLVRLIVTEYTALKPGLIVDDAGDAVIASEPVTGALTVRPPFTEPLTLPLVPVTVKVTDPVGVVVEVPTESVEVFVVLEVKVSDSTAQAGRAFRRFQGEAPTAQKPLAQRQIWDPSGGGE